MNIIRIEDPDGNLIKALIFTDDEDTMQEDEMLEYENEHVCSHGVSRAEECTDCNEKEN